MMSSEKSPDSDVSPRTEPVKSSKSQTADYFSSKEGQAGLGTVAEESHETNHGAPRYKIPIVAISRADTLGKQPEARKDSIVNSDRPASGRRKSSVAFQPMSNPSLPQGDQRTINKERLRASSPPTESRFSQHVAFDNLPVGEATKSNTPALSLIAKHAGYCSNKRSRLFMVGVDEHSYSDYALVWMMDQLVDDGDEVICVRVVDVPIRTAEKYYRSEAAKILEAIQEKNMHDRAISITLEYAVGKLHATFQKLIHTYQPSMLIVGTRGRSLGGLQGLVNSRNSFSKYCLQYSPVPVVVVRPDDKRRKKADKRTHDPTRQSYKAILAHNNGKHEADSEQSSLYEMETPLSADQEAHKVASALALPAQWDPTLKPADLDARFLPRGRASPRGSQVSIPSPPPGTRLIAEPGSSQRRPSDVSGSTAIESPEEESGEEEGSEGEFEVTPGHLALESTEKKQKLHAMEVGEAAALTLGKNIGLGDAGEEDEEEEGAAASEGTRANGPNKT